MKKRIGSILGLLLCAAMAFGQGQAIERDSAALTNTSPQPAGTKPFVQIDNRLGTGIVSIAYNFSGTIGTSSIVLKGCMRPGTAGLCDTLETNTVTTDTKRTVTGLYDWFTVTPTFTGGTNPVVNVNWTMIPSGVTAGNTIYSGIGGGTYVGVGGGASGDQLGNVSLGNFQCISAAGATSGCVLSVMPYMVGSSLFDETYYCDQSIPINTALASTTQLIALSGTKKIRVCSFFINGAGATTVKLQYGTGALCATGITDLTGAMSLAANTNVWGGVGGIGAEVLRTPNGQALCLVNSAAVQVSGYLTFQQR